jgi:hypothetical protein
MVKKYYDFHATLKLMGVVDGIKKPPSPDLTHTTGCKHPNLEVYYYVHKNIPLYSVLFNETAYTYPKVIEVFSMDKTTIFRFPCYDTPYNYGSSYFHNFAVRKSHEAGYFLIVSCYLLLQACPRLYLLVLLLFRVTLPSLQTPLIQLKHQHSPATRLFIRPFS